jgi:metal-dependent amidase/aminoacylase/carboxypeptidase family protein
VVALLVAATSTAADLDREIRTETERLQPALVEARRWFHQHPELSNREVETGRAIASRLAAVERVVTATCQAHRATCAVTVGRAVPPTVNDAALARSSAAVLRSALGESALVETEPIMAAEDFAQFAERVPGFYFHLGVGNPERGWTSYVHTPTFQPDEAAIGVGVRAAAALFVSAASTGR